MNPFQSAMTTGISTKADEEFIDLFEDCFLEMNFSTRKLVQFWVSLQTSYPLISTESLKVLIAFSSTCKCEAGFKAMVGIKSKFRNNTATLKFFTPETIANRNQYQVHYRK